METISRYLLTFLLNSIWQVPLILLVAFLVNRILGGGPPSHRHLVWVMALVASVAVPLASVRRGTVSQPVKLTAAFDRPAVSSAAASVAPAPSTAASARPQTVRNISLARSTAWALLGAYFIFLLLRCAYFAAAWRRTRRIVAGARPRGLSTPHIWARCTNAFGLSGVKLKSSAGISVPVAAGVFSKTVILPDSYFADLPEEVLTTAIGHEMAHLARHDFVLKLLYEALYLPLAFHPAAWFIRNRIESTREMACDELVTRQLIDRQIYARSIMSIAASVAGAPLAGVALGIFDGGDILEERIRRLLGCPAANLKRARLLLAAGLSTLAVCAVIASGLALTARAQSGSRDEINLGVAAYKSGDANLAIQHFRSAVAMDPSNIRPKLYLASVLVGQYQPGNPATALLAAEAHQVLLNVLALDPANKNALGSLMVLATNTQQFQEAHEWAQKLMEADPEATAAYYTTGFVDWSLAYPPYMRARAAAGMRPEDPGMIPDAAQRLNLQPKISPQIEEGLRMLEKALQLDPHYTDAMAYMNLLYRIKSAIADTPAESADLLKQADDWVRKALASKRSQAQRPPAAAPKPDADGPAPGPAFATAAPPPPPPPPPEKKQ